MQLEKRPQFTEYEPRLATWWVEKNFFTPIAPNKKKPFTILLPPPNANAPLHAGHVLYVIEDILARQARMDGRPTLFLPGTDHAGIETQFVFEKKLGEQGGSRLDFDHDTLYQMIHDFVEENRGIATSQLKRLGFSLDWSREKYTLQEDILKTVYETFNMMHDDGLIYRDERLVNYCTHCGTGFSNLEIDHTEKEGTLYYLSYGPITVATTRPETIFADVAIAVNPTDERYKDLIGKLATVPLINKEIPIIADSDVDPEFGTGALKITPGHDHTDFEIGKRNDLERISVIGKTGNMQNVPEYLLGLYPKQARKITVEKLTEEKTLIKQDVHLHSVATCYKCKNVIEPLLVPQWYVKTKPLVDAVLQKLNAGNVTIFPKRFDKELRRWLETAPDWNISRQIVWGPRIPAWYNVEQNPQIEITFISKNGENITGTYAKLKDAYSFDEIQAGLQSLSAPIGTPYLTELQSTGAETTPLQKPYLQETDTFDTWFSSGQWALTTLGYPDGDDFKKFYPTTVIDTMWDILPFWIMRMLMLSVYRTNTVPFEWIHLHSRVVDSKGQKMSKSRGNVINPIELVDTYGADTLRFALVFGIAPASDIPLGDEKLVGGRNFVTKLWNISRYILGLTALEQPEKISYTTQKPTHLSSDDQNIITAFNKVLLEVTAIFDINNPKNSKAFQFSLALEKLYDFIWNEFASSYLEKTKDRLTEHAKDSESANAALWALITIWHNSLLLLHPFMPFITEEIYQHMPTKTTETISLHPWPKTL